MTAPMSSPGASPYAGSTDWRAVAKGALAGLAIVVPVTVARAVLDDEIRDFDDSGWIYPLFVLILVAYGVAGWVAGRGHPDTPLIHGGLAGLGVVLSWIPIRVIIWAVREDGRGLVSGDRAALAPGQVFGALVMSVALGMLGATLAVRLSRRR